MVNNAMRHFRQGALLSWVRIIPSIAQQKHKGFANRTLTLI